MVVCFEFPPVGKLDVRKSSWNHRAVYMRVQKMSERTQIPSFQFREVYALKMDLTATIYCGQVWFLTEIMLLRRGGVRSCSGCPARIQVLV
jgi:hypothetical protein